MNEIEKTALRALLLRHAEMYPLSEPTDYIKLLYQGEFGGGHLITDAQMPMKYLKAEMETIADDDRSAFDEIGGGLLRMHLSAVRPLGLRSETVARLFMQTCTPRGSIERLREKLDVFLTLCEKESLLPDADMAAEAIAAYRAVGCPATHHSQRYREAYRAAYRLVPEQTRRFLPLLQRIDALLNAQSFVRIAIDGRCGAGKSTLGHWLQQVYDANLIHMDDFFLPMERKTVQRMVEPGGNIDYERFAREIASQPKDAPLTYHPFDCSTQRLGEAIHCAPNPLTIVEGSYARHPTLKDTYDLTVFLGVDPKIQSERLRDRCGEAMLARFINEWIPMEERYFESFAIREDSDLVFE